MEQLTEQLNEKAAAAVAQAAIMQHVRNPQQTLYGSIGPTTVPVAPASRAAATTQPLIEPHFTGVSDVTSPGKLSRFETAAMQRFLNDRKLSFFARTYDAEGDERVYRYAAPLAVEQSCVQCHAAQAAATQASAGDAPPLGMVTLEIASQTSTRQLLLNRVFILTAGLIGGLLAILIFYLVITRLILQPVRVLQETAERVSDGDLNIRSDINSGDEFQVLSETFNTMLANLKKSSDQLQAVNKSLDVKLGQLAESNVALYEANKLKSQFLANVSHELRTPLNSILGFAELLKELTRQSGEAKVPRYIQNIHSAGHNLLDLINDLLDLAKIEAGRMDVRSEPLSLPDLFEALTGLLKPLSEAKALLISTQVGPDVPIIETDPVKLQQVLYNLLSNAIKFSPNNTEVKLTAERTDDGVTISVIDQGPGIDASKQNLIFEKFRQLDQSVTREYSGTGLGLAISKELAQLMGGSIGVRSVVGQGSTFYISLPLKIVAGPKDVRERISLI